MTDSYDDILDLPRHVSTKHPQMPRINRAAQFTPFAALTGYDAAILETARLTDARIELETDAIALLDEKLCILADHLDEEPEVSITYFQPDGKKEGGAYVTAAGVIKKIDEHERCIVLVGGKRIAIEDILEIDCGLFTYFEPCW